MGRSVPYASRAEWKKKQRIRLFLIRVAIFLLCVALAVIGLLLLIFPSARVKSITVTGNRVTPTADILAAAGVAVGDKTFALERKQIVANIRNQYPMMQQVRVTRNLSEVTVEVSEEGVGYIAFAGYWFLLDRDLTVLTRCEDEENLAGYPQLVLPAIAKLSVGKQITFRDETTDRSYIGELLEVLTNEGLMPHVTYIDVSEQYHIFYVLDGQIRVVLGKMSEVQTKLEMTEQILGTRFENDSPYAIVDVSDLKKTTYREMQSADNLLSY